jgi:2-keto-3-deoxy-L-rhamnonate aldolase RhmA
MTVRLVRTPDIAYLAKTAGFDSLYVDMKHSPCSLDAAAQVCTAALHSGLTPLVRLATNTADEVSRVLDAGALGVIAPQIRTADEVREIVRAAKFQPIGERSVTGHLPQVMFDAVPDLMRVMNEATIVAINLETKDALDSVEEIAAVEGLDLLTIGTNDLTAELGIPGEYDNPIVRDAYRRVIAACNANGNHVGIGGLSRRSDLVEEFVRMGARYVSTGFDTMFLLAELRERAARVKQIQI